MIKFKKISALASLLIASMNMSAQSATITAQLDSMAIFIGGQVGLNVTATYPENEIVGLRQLTDTLTKDIEIVEALPIDTTISNGVVTLMQRYIITSFDTGLFYIPPIELLNMPDGSTKSIDNMALQVINPFQDIKVDEQSGVAQITDLREPYNAEFIFAELLQYWPWLVGLILLIGAFFSIRYIYLKAKARKAGMPIKKHKPDEPCEVTALRNLERIREEKLWQRNMFKEYYSDITTTLRQYISSRFKINAMESTSDEIIASLDEPLNADLESKRRIEKVLEVADLVKFAKQEPLPDENDMALKQAIEFVNATTAVPQAEDAQRNEEIAKTETK